MRLSQWDGNSVTASPDPDSVIENAQGLVGFQGGSVVENPPANARGTDSSPGPGRSPGEGGGTISSVLAWEIPWTEEPGGLQSLRSQKSQTRPDD